MKKNHKNLCRHQIYLEQILHRTGPSYVSVARETVKLFLNVTRSVSHKYPLPNFIHLLRHHKSTISPLTGNPYHKKEELKICCYWSVHC